MKHLDLPYVWASAAYVAFLVVIVALADLGRASWVFAASRLWSWGDKPSHLLLMGLLAYFANMALRGRRLSLFGARPLLGSIVVLLLVLAEEASQVLVRGRSADPPDAACDIAGIYLIGWLALWNLRLRKIA